MLDHFVIPTQIEDEDTKDDSSSKQRKFIEIDYLYMDNTFATHSESFPSQDEAFETLFKLIEDKRKEHVDSF
jgi:hypothetical protein